MAMTDARKRLIMLEVLGGILLLAVIWVVIQLAIATNNAAAEEERRETCLASTSDMDSYIDCIDAP